MYTHVHLCAGMCIWTQVPEKTEEFRSFGAGDQGSVSFLKRVLEATLKAKHKSSERTMCVLHHWAFSPASGRNSFAGDTLMTAETAYFLPMHLTLNTLVSKAHLRTWSLCTDARNELWLSPDWSCSIKSFFYTLPKRKFIRSQSIQQWKGMCDGDLAVYHFNPCCTMNWKRNNAIDFFVNTRSVGAFPQPQAGRTNCQKTGFLTS